MLEILVVMAAIYAIVQMAGKPRRRRGMGKYLRGNVDETFALGTLAAKTAILEANTDTVTERTLLSSLVLLWSLRGLTPASGDGPIMVGIAHSDYTLSEVESWIEQSTGWSEANLVAREVSQRKIRRVGVFGDDGGAVAANVRTLRQGRYVKTKLNWILTQGQSVNYWAYNMGTSALATTDPDVLVQGHANLWPR